MLQLRFIGTEKPPIWLVEERYIIGSGPGCHITLTHPSIKSLHAELLVNGEQVFICPTENDASVLINGLRVFDQTYLEHGTLLQIGEYSLKIVDPKRERPSVERIVPAPLISWALQSKSTALANKLFLVEKDMIVGRARECDLSLAVAHLSRRHARLFFEDGALWVEDLGSANGTFLNGRQVERAQVRGGDELAFDTLVFTVRGAAADEELEHDKTSIRPAISVHPQILSPRPGGSPNQGAALKAKGLREIKQSDAAIPPAPDASLVWLGIAAAVVLTAAAILYFTV